MKLKDLADTWRAKLVEAAVEQDDDAMMEYLEGNEPDIATLRKLIRKGTWTWHSCLFWVALRSKTKVFSRCLTLLSTICRARSTLLTTWALSRATRQKFVTSHAVRMTTCHSRRLAFKIWNDPFVGSLTFTRIYSGKLEKGDTFLNSTKGKKERVGRMMIMHSNDRDEIAEAFAGDIIALGGLKDTTTGDTLCAVSDPVVLETMTFPDPVIEIAVEPKTKGDQEKDGPRAPASVGRRSIFPRGN